MSVQDISDAAVLAELRRQLSLAAAKQTVSASNLANVDTPGFRAQELDFAKTLDSSLAGSLKLTSTHAGHLGTSASTATPTREADGLPSRRDGNNVQIDRELLAMTQAQGEFARAQTVLAAKFRLVRYAINEGR